MGSTYQTTGPTTGQPATGTAGGSLSAERLRKSPRRRRELEDTVESHAPSNVDVDIILTDEIETACVTSWDAVDANDAYDDIVGGHRLADLQQRCDGDYVMFVRASAAPTEYLPTSDQQVADRIMQFGFALHELGHIRYTPFTESVEIMDDRLDQAEHQYFDKILYNPGEDVRIEHLLREDLGEYAAKKQRGTHQLYRPPLDDQAPIEDYTFIQAVRSTFIDDGLYDRGVVDAALDSDDDRVQFADEDDADAFADLYPHLQELLAALKHDDGTEAVHRLIDFWQDHIKPAVDLPDTPDSLGDLFEDGPPIADADTSAGAGAPPIHGDLDDLTIVVVDPDAAAPSPGDDAATDGEQDGQAVEPADPDLDEGQAELGDFIVVTPADSADSNDGGSLDVDVDAEDLPGLPGDGLDEDTVDAEQADVDADRDALQPDGPGIDAEQDELEDTVAELTDGPDAGGLSVRPDPGVHSAASAARWNHIVEDAAGFVDMLALVFDDNDTTGFDAPYADGQRFDPRSAYRVPIGDPNILGVPARPDDKEYDLLLVLDRSGSMRGMMTETEDIVATFAVACRQLGINVSIIDFVEDDPRLVAPFETPLESVSPLLVDDGVGGGTPLGDVLEMAQTRMKHRPPSNEGLILVVTDGQPNADQQDKYHTQLENATDPVGGLTLVPGFNRDSLPSEVASNEQYFDRHEYVWSLDDLGDKMEDLVTGFSGLF
jgi:hypothetical protein